jgi:hypothetical protein
MQVSPEIRQRFVLVLGNLICRCIEEARKIPYILDQEQVVEILVRNPSFYEKLVHDEQRDRTEFASDRLTARIDALTELGQFEALDAFAVSFSGSGGPDVDLDPVLEQVNHLTRTFAVYIGNMITIFEKEFQVFMERFHQSLQQAGIDLRALDLTPEDMVELEKKAEAYLTAGLFLQAFSFDRMLNSEVITNELIGLPSSGYSFNQHLIRRGLKDAGLRAALVKFILRASYVSQGSWQDLFVSLVTLVDQEPELCGTEMLVERIEQDGVFCCNLLCESFSDLLKWTSGERRATIERRLENWRRAPGSV